MEKTIKREDGKGEIIINRKEITYVESFQKMYSEFRVLIDKAINHILK